MVVWLGFYSLTFVAYMISGIRWSFCLIRFECSDATRVALEHSVEIRNWGHLIAVIIGKLLPISLKLLTCSSALATYLSSRQANVPVSCSSLNPPYSPPQARPTSGRWHWNPNWREQLPLGTTEKAKYIADTNRKRLQNAKGQGHVHLAFFFDAAAYGGLIVLNSYILHNYIWWQLKLYDWQNYVESWQLPGFESCWGSWLELPMLYHYMITQSPAFTHNPLYQHTACTDGIENLICTSGSQASDPYSLIPRDC